MTKVFKKLFSTIFLLFSCYTNVTLYAGVHLQHVNAFENDPLIHRENSSVDIVEDVPQDTLFSADQALRTIFTGIKSGMGYAINRPMKALLLFLALQNSATSLKFPMAEAFEVTNLNQNLTYSANDLSIQLLPMSITSETPVAGCTASITLTEPFLTSCMGPVFADQCTIASTSSIAQAYPVYTQFSSFVNPPSWGTTDFLPQSYLNNILSSIIVSRGSTKYSSLITLTSRVLCLLQGVKNGTIQVRYVTPTAASTLASTVSPTSVKTTIKPSTTQSSITSAPSTQNSTRSSVTASTSSISKPLSSSFSLSSTPSTYFSEPTSFAQASSLESRSSETTASSLGEETQNLSSESTAQTFEDMEGVPMSEPPYAIIGSAIGGVVLCAGLAGIIACLATKRNGTKKNPTTQVSDRSTYMHEFKDGILQSSSSLRFDNAESHAPAEGNLSPYLSGPQAGVYVNSLHLHPPNQSYTMPGYQAGYNNLPVKPHYEISLPRADIYTTDHYTNLSKAAEEGDRDMIEMFLGLGVSVDMVNAEGYTPLQLAAQAGKEDACKLLLSRGANKSFKTKDGKLAAMLAYENGHRQLADLLADS